MRSFVRDVHEFRLVAPTHLVGRGTPHLEGTTLAA
jgi:hypothetical protein